MGPFVVPWSVFLPNAINPPSSRVLLGHHYVELQVSVDGMLGNRAVDLLVIVVRSQHEEDGAQTIGECGMAIVPSAK